MAFFGKDKNKDDDFQDESLADEDDYSWSEPDEEPGGKVNPFEDPDYVFDEEHVDIATGWRALAGSIGIVALLLLFHGCQLGSWIRREKRTPSWDQSVQLEIAHDYSRVLKERRFADIFTLAAKPGMPPFPPLYHLTLQYAMNEADPASAALWVNLFYMALLCAALWGIAHKAAGAWGAAAAVVLFTCAPEIQWLMREQLLDLALTAWVAAAYWALLASEKFQHRKASNAFGALFGLAMLTKWSAFSYFLPVFWWAMEAVQDRQKLRNFLRAAMIAAALCAPWYLVQWAVVLPRLVGAASDNAVSLTTMGGLFSYFHQMGRGLEFPFLVAGVVCLTQTCAAKRSRKDSEMLLAWFFSSLLFWMIVPNRQLRYLLPGLIPMAVMVGAVGGRNLLIGLCALQLLAAANYSKGWISPRTFGVGVTTASFFRTQLPRDENWKIPEILRSADARRDKSVPFSNLTLLANDVHFNSPSFQWEVDRLGVGGIRVRGVNRRVCEFSEFLVMKMGPLGPKEVVNQLPKLRQDLMVNTGWFMRGYRDVEHWALPDGSEAVLFERRKLREPLLSKGAVRFDYLEEKGFLAQGMIIDLGGFDRKRGVYPKVRIRAKSLSIRGLKATDVDLEMEDLVFVTVRDPEGRARKDRQGFLLDVRLLGMKRLTLRSGRVSAEAAAEFFKKRVPGTRSVRVRLDEEVALRADIRGLRVSAAASLRISPGKDALLIALERLSVGGLPVPVSLLGPSVKYRLGFEPDPELPFELDIRGLSIAGGELRIGS